MTRILLFTCPGFLDDCCLTISHCRSLALQVDKQRRVVKIPCRGRVSASVCDAGKKNAPIVRATAILPIAYCAGLCVVGQAACPSGWEPAATATGKAACPTTWPPAAPAHNATSACAVSTLLRTRCSVWVPQVRVLDPTTGWACKAPNRMCIGSQRVLHRFVKSIVGSRTPQRSWNRCRFTHYSIAQRRREASDRGNANATRHTDIAQASHRAGDSGSRSPAP